jgi:beta-glucosidase
MKRTGILRNIALVGILVCNLSIVKAQQANQAPQLGKASIKEVIAAMTLEEKASLVVGAGIEIPPAMKKFLPKGMPDPTADPNSLAGKTKNPVAGAVGFTAAIPRLGIPTIVVDDGPAGLRISTGSFGSSDSHFCTAFPIGSLLASTWDKSLIYQVGTAYGNEVKEYGVDILLAPGMNIQRNPLNGRNFEYYSEDPYVSGNIAAAMVSGIQSQGVGTSIKHFVANNQETERQSVNEIISERALREIYLEGFRIAVEEGKPWTVMSSYNLVNGKYTSENYDLLTKILRDDWKFKGFVMSDWSGGKDAVAQMKAGNNLLMPGPRQVQALMQAVKDGKLDEKVLDKNIEGILNIMLLTPRFKGYKYSDKPDLKANALTARQAATQGMVLLKNEKSALPLTGIKNIAAFGNATYETYVGGSGSGYASRGYTINISDGLKNAGYTINTGLEGNYTNYIKSNTPITTDFIASFMGGKKHAPEMPLSDSLVQKAAAGSDIAIFTIGRNAGEGIDRTVENDFDLSATEKSNLSLLTKAFHAKGKKVVLLINSGGVIETASWRDMPDAILMVWQPGQEAGNAVADVVSGKVNPSGKLTETFPMAYSDVPSSKSFPGDSLKKDTNSVITRKIAYTDGIYVGYRYYNTFKVKTAYEFGYGLSYTTFKYSDLKLDKSTFDGSITATFTITNTGSAAGQEVAELYLSAPKGKLDKPVEELKGFAKTGLLKPGEFQQLTITLNGRSLASFDTDSSSWIADAGTYTLKVGASSKDIKLTKSFDLPKTLLVEKVSKALAPRENLTELK